MILTQERGFFDRFTTDEKKIKEIDIFIQEFMSKTQVNIFVNNRKRHVSETRSLAWWLLYDLFNLKDIDISKYFSHRGLDRNRSSIFIAIREYRDVYVKYNDTLKEYEQEMREYFKNDFKIEIQERANIYPLINKSKSKMTQKNVFFDAIGQKCRLSKGNPKDLKDTSKKIGTMTEAEFNHFIEILGERFEDREISHNQFVRYFSKTKKISNELRRIQEN